MKRMVLDDCLGRGVPEFESVGQQFLEGKFEGGDLGVGVDRVVMLITGRSIRETLPFPLAKPR